MFNQFTDRARQVIVLAQEQARELNHGYIGTEHLLAGMLAVDGVAHKLLTVEVPDLAAVRTKIEELVGRGQLPPTGHIPFTPRAKKALELTQREAWQLGHKYIGTEHLLLAVFTEAAESSTGGGRAVEILTSLGVSTDLDEWRAKVLEIVPAVHQPAVSPDQPQVFVSNLLDAIADFAKRTGATITISYPGDKR